MGVSANLAPIAPVGGMRPARDAALACEIPEIKKTAYDLVILGGGCAGLSLALRLAKLGERCPRTLLLERRISYTNDRTWCFWGTSSQAVGHLVDRSWSKIRVQRLGHRAVVAHCGAMPYQMIGGETFYREALAAITKSKHIDLALGAAVLDEPRRIGDRWHVESSEGVCRGKELIDTRPAAQPQSGEAVLWQSFYGQEIECEGGPIFDPECADLMDFTGSGEGRVDFNYVLPFSQNRALVEATVFGREPLRQNELAEELRTAIERRTKGAKFQIVRSESGVLPMGAMGGCRAVDRTYIRAGLTAGGARTSTGYAFQRIQRWADACAQLLGNGHLPAGHPADPVLLQGLDFLFISVLRSRPELAPEIFLSLFERAETARIIRFLSDRGTMRDYAAIAAALPVFPFVHEMPTALLRKLNQLRRRTAG